MGAVSFVESAGSGGHLLVLQGDLTALAVDAVLVPCDADGNVHAGFGPLLAEAGVDITQTTFGEGFVKVGAYRAQVGDDAGTVWLGNAGERQVWLLDTTVGTRRDVATLVSAVGAAIDQVAKAVGSGATVVLPLVGVNAGGFGSSYFSVIAGLIPALESLAADLDIDVVLVTRARADYAAVQHFRRDQLIRDDAAGAGDAADEAEQVLTELADLARKGQLVPFIGAGASMGAGAPSWWALLQSLARDAGISDDELPALQELDARDAAMVIARRSQPSPDGVGPAHEPSMAERYEQIKERIRAEVDGDLCTVTQGLIAGLALPEAVTTNYDRQYELANTAASGASDPAAFDVVPKVRPSPGSPWVLKIHGDVGTPESIVISRDDYLRFDRDAGPAAGILQSRMLTGHLLFVGYSMSDENIVRLARDVQRYREAFAAADAQAPVGTVLELVPNPLRHQLWDGTLDFVTFGVPSSAGAEGLAERNGSGDAARRLRVFLDRLAMLACDDVPFLLDAKYRDLVMGKSRIVEHDPGGAGPEDGRQESAAGELLAALEALGAAASAVEHAGGQASSAVRVAAARVGELLAEMGWRK